MISTMKLKPNFDKCIDCVNRIRDDDPENSRSQDSISLFDSKLSVDTVDFSLGGAFDAVQNQTVTVSVCIPSQCQYAYLFEIKDTFLLS